MKMEGTPEGWALANGEMYLADRQVNRMDRHVVVATVTDVWATYSSSLWSFIKDAARFH